MSQVLVTDIFVASFDDKVILQLQELNTSVSAMTDTLRRTHARTVI